MATVRVPLRRRIRRSRAARPSRATRLLIVGGKGGVGKTSCAAALAAAVARSAPHRRVLWSRPIPAHSLGDVFGQPLGARERRIRGAPGNLSRARSTRPGEWRARREQYRSRPRAFSRSACSVARGSDVDRAIIEELLALAPPGMDEIVGILTILTPGARVASSPRETDGKQSDGRFDVDWRQRTNGHTQRLLALPAQAQAWGGNHGGGPEIPRRCRL